MSRATLALALMLLAARSPGAEPGTDEPSTPAEPPPEAGAGDWTIARADSLARGWVETTFAASGSGRTSPRTAERIRFHGTDAEGDWRTGDDALGGGSVAAPLGAGALHAGRLAPRWGRGLVLGAPAQPWSVAAEDRGERAAWRGRAGEGAAYRTHGGALELLAGRFARRTLAGARWRVRPLALAVLGGPGGAQASLGVAAGGADAEAAIDPRGRWRAESCVRGRVPGGAVVLRARGGLAGFRSLAEPARSGPARALSASLDRAGGRWRVRGWGALWAFAPGASGAGAALEVDRRLVHHATVAFGFDEQHGVRREGVAAPAAAFRQGAWCAWRGRIGDRTLELRHDLRGGGAFARPGVRRVVTARGESRLPGGATLAFEHTAFLSRGGETLWLAEPEPDRLTLRAAPASGQRSRAELGLPVTGGRARIGVNWTTTPARRGTPAWRVEWTHRTRQ